MLENPNIVIVDDEPMVTGALSAFFELETEYVISAFNNPTEAIEYIKNNTVSLVISDFLMPQMNGIEFLSQVKEIHPDVSTILLTGYADKNNAIKAINEIGLYKYLEKPWNNDDLLITVKNGIERSYLVQSLNEKIQELKIANDKLENYNAELEIAVQQRTAELSKTNSQLSAIIENCADGIALISSDGQILNVNPAFETMSGTSLSNLQNKEFSKILFNEEQKSILNEINNDKEIFIRNYKLINTSKNKFIPVEISCAPIKEDGKTSQFVIVIRDITTQVEMERLRDDFIATLTHDLRTPLLAAIQTLRFFLDGSLGTLNERQHKLLEMMVQSNQDMLGLVNALLEVYKYESGQLELCCENININELIISCLNSVKSLAENKKIDIKLELATTETIWADKQELRRVLANLLGNAITYTSENGEVKIKTSDENGELTVIVEDNGSGIPKIDIPKMFNRFSQGTTTKRSTGTGLGLYLSRQIIEAHKGKIWLESEVGKGSKFIFTLSKQKVCV